MLRLAFGMICISLALSAISAQIQDGRTYGRQMKATVSLFTAYVQINGKQYSSIDEYNYRSQVFEQNLQFVLGKRGAKIDDSVEFAENNGSTVIKIKQFGNACDFQMSANKFFDLSDEEFKSYYLLPSDFFDEKKYKPVSKIVTEKDGKAVITTLSEDADPIEEAQKEQAADADKTKRVKSGAQADDKADAISEVKTCLHGMKRRMDVSRLNRPADEGMTKSCKQVINIKRTVFSGQSANQSYSQSDSSLNFDFSRQFAERKLQAMSYPAKYLKQNFDSYVAIGKVNVPTYLDWSQISPLTPVKDQKKCNSCYVFSATAALEAHNSIANSTIATLSEQEILDCSTENEGCTGGQPYLVYDYAIQNGLSYDKYYGYTAKPDTCKAGRISSSRKFSGLRGYVFPKPGVLNVLKALQYGPVVILMHASNELKYYYDGIYEGQGCTEDDTPNHSALVYGYNLDTEKPYFLLKNNWGTGWGDAGFYKMAIGPLTSSNMGYCLLAQTRYNVLPIMSK